MKRWMCVLLAGILLLSMTACKKKENITPTQTEANQQDVMQDAAEPENIEGPFTYHSYALETVANEPDVKILTVIDKTTEKEIQTIRLDKSEWFILQPIYADITFDGNRDILVPAQKSASGAFFIGYIWDKVSEQYVYAPSLKDIPNIALDTANRMLLSCSTASRVTNYSMYRYNKDTQDFEVARNLRWEPAEQEGYVTVVESQFTDGREEKIKTFSAQSADGMVPNKADANVAPYYAAGSLWELDNAKWRNWVYTP